MWDGNTGRVNAKLIDVLDGAMPGFPDFSPKASTAPDGRLWFVNGTVAQMFDPAHPAFNRIRPPVHIESIIADHRLLTPEHELHLPALTRQLEIDYTALSFVLPQKVKFRYKLEGHDADWQDADTRRQAFYNDLPPGAYTFHVIACNNSGVWNETGASSSFVIPPAWYQTLWFRVGVLIFAFAALWAAYLLRLRQVRVSMRVRFNERLDERTRMARDLHDTLLQTIQGSKLAAEDALVSSSDATTRQSIEKLVGWLGRAVEEGRAALNALRYSRSDTNDLVSALRLAVDESLIDERMQSNFDVSGVPKTMQPVVRDEVYQIAYEAIRNACAHSGATLLVVSVRYGRDLVICIRDNGKGIAAGILEHGKKDHHGLSGMRERAERIGATLHIASSALTGTEIVLTVPGSITF
jgi:signal transduction histidine kinase